MISYRIGGGFLWDLEFLTDDRGRRVAAFGRSAGVVGMALGSDLVILKSSDINLTCFSCS